MKGIQIYGDTVNIKAFAMVPAILLEDRRLSQRDKIVYIALLSIIKSKNTVCYASAETISKKSGVGRTSIFQALSHLETLGYITRRSRKGTTDVIHISPLPVFDFDDSLYGGSFFGDYAPVDKLCKRIVEKAPCDYLVFNNQTRRVQFLNGSVSETEHDIEKLLKIIEEFRRRCPDMPTGLEKKSARLDVLDVIIRGGYDVGIVDNIVAFVNKSSFVRGINARGEKKTLRWLIENYATCLDEDSQYLDYEYTREFAEHERQRAAFIKEENPAAASCAAMQAADN